MPLNSSCSSSPLHGEGSDGAGGRVDAQVLEVGDPQAAGVAEDPRARQAVGHVGQPRRHQHHQVGDGQAHQVTVGGGPHVAGGEDHHHHHDVAHDAHATHQQHQEHRHRLVLQQLGDGDAGTQGDVGRGVDSGARVVGHV